MHIKKYNESLIDSKNKMKYIVDDTIKYKIGGGDYFNTIDQQVKLTKNIDLIQNNI